VATAMAVIGAGLVTAVVGGMEMGMRLHGRAFSPDASAETRQRRCVQSQRGEAAAKPVPSSSVGAERQPRGAR
jgi:hypothetical protein